MSRSKPKVGSKVVLRPPPLRDGSNPWNGVTGVVSRIVGDSISFIVDEDACYSHGGPVIRYRGKEAGAWPLSYFHRTISFCGGCESYVEDTDDYLCEGCRKAQ